MTNLHKTFRMSLSGIVVRDEKFGIVFTTQYDLIMANVAMSLKGKCCGTHYLNLPEINLQEHIDKVEKDYYGICINSKPKKYEITQATLAAILHLQENNSCHKTEKEIPAIIELIQRHLVIK